MHSLDYKNRDVLIVMPALNEASVIGSVLLNVKAAGFENILVVDDSSTDETGEIAQRCGARVLAHAINRGKGACVRLGFAAANLLGARITVVVDADGQHDAKDIARLVSEINNGNDVALGVRDFNRGKMPKIKVVANYIGNIVTYLICGILIRDSQCGLRAYSRKAFTQFQLQEDGFAHESEVIKEVARNNMRFAQVPVNTVYTAYSISKKNGQGLRNGLKTLRQLISHS